MQNFGRNARNYLEYLIKYYYINNPDTIKIYTFWDITNILTPVSYTHLDVYKRQLLQFTLLVSLSILVEIVITSTFM